MVIRHNTPAADSLGKLNVATVKVKKASEQLATGFRINRAADDAAGLAVSEKMRSQIRGLQQASRNCLDGINLAQTFEGALAESHSIIRRCKEIAEEAANGNYDDPTDRAALELEFRQLCDEINAISDTDFNGVVMLNGGKLACAKDTGLGWLNPLNVRWKPDTFINQTDDPNFNMQITKLPALDEMTMVTAEEFEALEQFNMSTISVDLSNGSAQFGFSNTPLPKNVSITTRGNAGYVAINTASGPVEIAKVTLPNVSRDVTTKGMGRWSSSTGNVSITVPSTVSLVANDAGAAYKDRRAAYDKWNASVPTVVFKVSDDLQHFTIPANLNPNGAQNVKDYDPDKVYDIGATVVLLSTPECESKVSWSATYVKPGTTIQTYPMGYSSLSATDDLTNGRDKYNYSIHYPLSLGTVSSTGRAPDGSNRECFLAHGRESFTITYKETAVTDENGNHISSGDWKLTISNYDTAQGGSSPFTTSDIDVIDKYLTNFGLSRTNVTDDLADAHANGNKFDSVNIINGAPNGTIPIRDYASYTFSFTIRPPSPSSLSGTAWEQGKEATSLDLKEYDPNVPEKGGVDYDVAQPGNIYTYRNDKLVDTVDPGYWVNQNGETIDLEAEGIYLPDAKNRGFYNDVLHDGLTITVGEKISGATGKALSTVQLWQPSETPFTPIPNDDLNGLTYADNMIIQSNARTKDSVNFTFIYNSGNQGELVCDLNCSAKGLGMSGLDLSTQVSSNDAIDKLDHSLNKVSMVRACFGAICNRLEHKTENLAVTRENVTASESQIRDTDMAAATVEFTKAQIVQQAAQTTLAQANQLPQSVLQLLQ